MNIGQDPPIELPGIRFNTTNSGLGVSVGYDGRNTTFTPTAGTRLELKYTRYDEALGGDFNYDMYESAVFQYLPTAEYSSLGLRLEIDALRGDAPFFAYPFISLRGIPALRYQGDAVVTGELEYLWGFTPRWSAGLARRSLTNRPAAVRRRLGPTARASATGWRRNSASRAESTSPGARKNRLLHPDVAFHKDWMKNINRETRDTGGLPDNHQRHEPQ